jgi:hypothetical protein
LTWRCSDDRFPDLRRAGAKVGFGACVTDAPSEYAGAELYERRRRALRDR